MICSAPPFVRAGLDNQAGLLAPAMNNNMWDNPAVQHNVETAKEMGFQVIGPVKGRLACGTEGIGRMAEPQDILEAIEKIASTIKRKATDKHRLTRFR